MLNIIDRVEVDWFAGYHFDFILPSDTTVDGRQWVAVEKSTKVLPLGLRPSQLGCRSTYHLYSFHHDSHVLLVVVVVGIEQRPVQRVSRSQAHPSAAAGPQQNRVDGEGVPREDGPEVGADEALVEAQQAAQAAGGVPGEGARAEGELDVGSGQRVPQQGRAHERDALGAPGRRQRTAAVHPVVHLRDENWTMEKMGLC